MAELHCPTSAYYCNADQVAKQASNNPKCAALHCVTSLLPGCPEVYVTGCRFVNTVLTWLINPIVLGSVIVFIGFWLIIVRGKLKRYFRESNKLKEEFDKYRREMQLKVSVWAPRGLTVASCTYLHQQKSPQT